MTSEAPTYRYLLCDLLTDQVLAQLPLTGVSFERRISQRGTLNATLNAPRRDLVDAAKLCFAYAGRSALWVYRDNAIWWGGIPWTVTPKQTERGPVAVTISASTFDSYAHHRIFPNDHPAGWIYTQWDQNEIVAKIWQRIQGRLAQYDGSPGDQRGDIGVECDYPSATIQPSGILRDRTYLTSEQKYAGQLIEELGAVIDGPEHTIDTWVDDTGTRHKTLRVADRLGSPDPTIVFQRVSYGGGRLLTWEHTADAVDGGTTFRTRGDAPNGNVGETTYPLLSDTVYRYDLLADGWPLLDVTEDHPGTIDVTTLTGHAQALAQERGGSLPTSTYTVQIGETGWSPNRIGDAVRMKITDDWHDNVDVVVRPVACKVDAAEKGKPETVTLTFSTV